MNEKSKIVFLDRDGTINTDFGYVTQPEKVELIDGAAKAIGDLVREGLSVVVVSNQSAIGRGFATWADVDATNQRLQQLLLEEDPDARLVLVLCSPDAPWEASETRKPKTGLADEVRKHLIFDTSDCWVVGDKERDIEFGLNLGLPAAHCILLAELPSTVMPTVRIASSLKRAVEIIMQEL